MYPMYGQPYNPAYRHALKAVERKAKGGSTLSVRGMGKVETAPDTAVLQLAVVTMDKDVTAAQEENKRRVNQLIRALAAMGIDEKQIETISYTVFPQYDYSAGSEPVLKGYEAVNTLSVRTRDLDTVGSIYDAAFANGANRSDSLQFFLSDQQKWINQVLDLAAKQALEKAEAIALSYRLNLNRTPVKITEESRGFSPLSKELSLGVQSAGQTPIFARQIEVTAELEVVFSYQ
ncbi:SIMPL domain-containing protein [Metabacillus sp. JX24]|uniref:SIMPL domain-containing protein n=1 Tax=Metabacillus sp. JX24 TaxID=3240759 RepID=UPI003510185A